MVFSRTCFKFWCWSPRVLSVDEVFCKTMSMHKSSLKVGTRQCLVTDCRCEAPWVSICSQIQFPKRIEQVVWFQLCETLGPRHWKGSRFGYAQHPHFRSKQTHQHCSLSLRVSPNRKKRMDRQRKKPREYGDRMDTCLSSWSTAEIQDLQIPMAFQGMRQGFAASEQNMFKTLKEIKENHQTAPEHSTPIDFMHVQTYAKTSDIFQNLIYKQKHVLKVSFKIYRSWALGLQN